ncbi:MAG: redoxin domain-containing protein [Tunicatimonas sp.]|uniref:peroxiredoxin family protein n=1 Tax=Tunicatimonas sp. TaxID=1940096 RepID=UPI003C7625D5
MNTIKAIGCTAILVTLLGTIIAIFWDQQIRYLKPTVKPKSHTTVIPGTQITLSFLREDTKPIFLHFYNPDCPCSKFNQDHFRQLVRRYKGQVNFYTIVPNNTEEPLSQELNIPIISDSDGVIADACGIYATPQAVILTAKGTLYYQGNYNKARYCTTRSTRFAELALQSAITEQPLPLAVQRAGLPYGCNLPSDTNTGTNSQTISLTNLFN